MKKLPSAILLAALCGASGHADEGHAARPNVLLILVDDLNDWVGCLGGHPQARTPNIDRLAARGLLFTNAHTAYTLCCPSRAALFTGVRPHVLDVYGNQAGWTVSLAGRTTLPEHFKASGYLVLGSGKVFHGPGRGTTALDRVAAWGEEAWWGQAAWWDGFVRFKDVELAGETPRHADPDENRGQGLEAGLFEWAAFEGEDEDVPDHGTVGWAVDRLRQGHERPFFIACGIFLPHLPWFVPSGPDWQPLESIELPSLKADDLEDVPAIAVLDHKRAIQREVAARGLQRQAVQAYLAAISFADRQVGRLLDALDASPHAKDTIVVLWSDHGYHLGEKETWHKQTLWEEATRIPLIFVVPGVTRPDSRCARAVDSLSVFPTLCRACGLDVPAQASGPDLAPLLADPVAPFATPAITTSFEGNHSVRTERWRYTRYRDGSEELYDHDVDPNEWTNLAARPELVEVRTSLAVWLPER